jgi:hypothetical protein
MREAWKNEAAELGIEHERLINIYEEKVLEEYKRYEEMILRIEKEEEDQKGVLEKIACLEVFSSLFAQREEQMGLEMRNSASSFSYIVGVITNEV